MKVYGYIDPDVIEDSRFFESFYVNQRVKRETREHQINQQGGLIPNYFVEYGVEPQSGEGFGTVLRGLWRMFKPALISGAKAVGKQAITSAGGFAGDVIRGVDWQDAGKEHFRDGTRVLAEKLAAKMTGSGRNKMARSRGRRLSLCVPSGVRGRSQSRRRRRKRSRAPSKAARGSRKRKRSQSVFGGEPSRKRRRTASAKRRRRRGQRKTQRGQGLAIGWL